MRIPQNREIAFPRSFLHYSFTVLKKSPTKETVFCKRDLFLHDSDEHSFPLSLLPAIRIPQNRQRVCVRVVGFLTSYAQTSNCTGNATERPQNRQRVCVPYTFTVRHSDCDPIHAFSSTLLYCSRIHVVREVNQLDSSLSVSSYRSLLQNTVSFIGLFQQTRPIIFIPDSPI